MLFNVGIFIKWVQHIISNITWLGLVNTWATRGEIVKAMTCGDGRAIGSGFKRFRGTTIGIYIDKPKNNTKNISLSSQWTIMLVVDFNFRFNYTSRGFLRFNYISRGFQGWNPKYRSSNIKETYGLVNVKM